MTTHEVVLPLFSPLASGEKPMKRYRTLVADPPWHYAHSWNSYRGAGKERSVTQESDYPTMTVDQIMNMGVGLWAEDRSHLYLWTTHAYMIQAHQIAKAWGFDVKSILTWIKRRPPRDMERDSALDDRWLGMGTYFRSVSEFVVFATRGNLDTKRTDEPTVFFAPRGVHSEKPAAFYDMVERMSPGPYLDVFARKQRFNWDTFGNESFDFREHGIWHTNGSTQ